MASRSTTLRQLGAAVRVFLLLSVVLGILYPLAVTALAQIPGLKSKADGSLVYRDGRVVGSSLIGQQFLDAQGKPLPRYFQPRPSLAGDGYDPSASGGSNLGPESVVDTLPTPGEPDSGSLSLLSQVCQRSLAVGALEHVDGRRPYCTPDGYGAVLAVFYAGPGYQGAITRVVAVNQATPAKPFVASYQGVPVQAATPGADYSRAKIVAIHGDAPAHPAVPADAVTASGSGLDPDISTAYAALQVHRVAAARGVSDDAVRALVSKYTGGQVLAVFGMPGVNVLELNLALDREYPAR